jgi:ApaG protein
MKENKGKELKVNVVAQASYVPEQSSPLEHRFMWSYHITISNLSDEILQLLNRYWRIIDMTGHIEEVRGPGVVGLQPIIKPGNNFVYSSFCQLNTPQGTMEGFYEMQNLNDIKFLVQIPKFILASPDSMSSVFRSRLH